ncbi:MAG: CRISPR-associated endonuclease Cas2 [Oscillospiraceae bacterium]|nr:CRISPR-associated endonuclease Cas2 [Oscillospiraceae bacterium]
MYLILTYDISEERVNKVRKHLKKYLTWVQNSVFEGEISQGKFNKCLKELEKIIDRSEDSVYIYELEYKRIFKKEVLGITKGLIDYIV